LSSLAIHPAADTSFALMDGRPVLFSEANQKIYELDRVGAYVWCKLLEQETIKTIFEGLAEFGIDRSEARLFLRQALRNWLDCALVDVDCEPSADFTLRIRLAQRTISIRASNEQLLQQVAPLFCNTNGGTGTTTDVLVEIIELDDEILFRINNCGTCWCERHGLAPAIKARLVEYLIVQDQSDLTLHAASLISNREGLLLCGQPGAGKSTLALHLTDAGLRYGGDDLVLIAQDGMAEGIPFAPTVKPGSWEMISRLRNDLDHAVVHCRPDGVRVRYLPVDRVHNGSFSVGWIVFLNRMEGAAAELTPLGQIEAMRRVIAGSFAASGELSRSGFVALKRTLATAKLFELSFSDAVQARSVLMDFCHGQL
jgi:energy-coupling factor transporter ATP-binding protein EcfA2